MKIFNSLLFCLLLNFFITGEISFAETPIMPEDIIDTARLRNCHQIEDFYKGRTDLNPPFLYGFSGKGISSAFLCEKGLKENRMFILVVNLEKMKGQTPTCQNEIVLKNFPGGLTLFPPEGLPEFPNYKWRLKDFNYLSNPSKIGPDRPLEHNGIMESYDGNETIYYCHNGNWLFRSLD